MSRPPRQKKPKPPGAVSDMALWNEVKSTVKPLTQRDGSSHARSARSDGNLPKPNEHETPADTGKDQPMTPRPVADTTDGTTKPAPSRHGPLSGLDRRTRQKLARGNAEIDGRLDLHGMTKENARYALLAFLTRARANQCRTVLVITGKGKSPIARHTLHSYDHIDIPEREGILRRALPDWLREPEFLQHVTGFQPAHPRHGGGGAFYVRLRKPGGNTR